MGTSKRTPEKPTQIRVKESLQDKTAWFLSMIYQSTIYSVSCVEKFKKERIVKKIVQYWIEFFGYPKRIWEMGQNSPTKNSKQYVKSLL